MISLINYTENPLSYMGTIASVCWHSNPKDLKQVGIDCITSGHGRVMEYPDIIIEINEYSARMMRELYTHIIGTTRLQESTRYVDCSNFKYYIPDSIKNNENALESYTYFMERVKDCYGNLLYEGIPRQDVANILPLGMYSSMILKINLRALIHMAELRMCNRTLKEYRDFMQELKSVLEKIDGEWKYICDNYMKAKCEKYKICEEKASCGKYDCK